MLCHSESNSIACCHSIIFISLFPFLLFFSFIFCYHSPLSIDDSVMKTRKWFNCYYTHSSILKNKQNKRVTHSLTYCTCMKYTRSILFLVLLAVFFIRSKFFFFPFPTVCHLKLAIAFFSLFILLFTLL